jgi:hypothetical protein
MASRSPVDAPDGTIALPKEPFSVVTSTSTVGEDPDQIYIVPDTDTADAATTVDAAPALGDMSVTKQTTKGGYGAQTVARRVADENHCQ